MQSYGTYTFGSFGWHQFALLNQLFLSGLATFYYASRLIKLGQASEQNLINRGLLLAKNPSTPTSAKRLPTRKVKSTKCPYPDCRDTSHKRGLCRKHHAQYVRRRSKLSAIEREKLDKDLIKRKLLLPEKPATLDPFQIGSKVRGNLHKY